MNYDFSQWHKACDKTILLAPDGMHVVCLAHGVSANIEAVSAKISPADTYKLDSKERKLVGKLSPGVPFEGVKE